ncbi:MULTISPECIES: hypothetical protein [unclassified Sphingomonas]|uniref:hypothetical protein n=1 Tax=unclassified Sphingomonas TaxID=196159 RepID=UPI0006F8AEFA|nr:MULTISPECIES: hypothetical protein [unclassified Sphingomonas]KQM64787.1 hypothetical protein ASE65_16180 [Sphingomonas sp. Leaf16]KQN16920.1 hypothetical protein ASE81_16235 [Sphingomonas sp. Leaf29]KQN22901.1 hypothetical protein ASE83_16160 [Sphingomonas sp. Leaf32]
MATSITSAEELARARRDGKVAAETFDETLRELVEAIVATDAVEVLARAGFHLLMRGPDRPEQVGKEGVELSHLELIQALALSTARGAGEADTDYPAITSRVLNLIGRNVVAYRDRTKLKLNGDQAHDERTRLLALIQSWTLAVRGARHEFQTRRYAFALAKIVDASFHHHHGCTATSWVQAIGRFYDLVEERLQAERASLRRWVRKKSGIAMIHAFVEGLDDKTAAEISTAAMPYRYDRDHVTALLINRFEQRLSGAFTLCYEDLVAETPTKERDALIGLLRRCALRFGEVDNSALERLHLDNPVRMRPFIELDAQSFFCPVPHILGVQMSEMLEDLCAINPTLKEKAEKARADLLEEQLADVVRRFLPSAEVREKVKWSEDGGITTWESDLVAVIDKTVLAFEAKSAKISSPARRGAVNSLKDALKELVVKPSRQSLRFKARVDNADGPLHFDTAQGPFTINAGAIRSVIRVNILQDPVGPLSSHWPQLACAGFVPAELDIAPSMTVFDLETVFETLSLEIERCHYLARRAELERNAVYTADELDLLAVYQEHQFNIGEAEFDGTRLEWYGASLRLTPEYSARRAEGTLSAQMRRTGFWADLLGSLEQKREVGWTRLGHRLLNANVNVQRRVERLYEKGMQAVSRDPSKFFTSGVTVGSRFRLDTISVSVGAPESPEQFEDNLQYAAKRAFEQGGQQSLLALYWFVPKSGEAYDFIGVMRRHRTASGVARKI